MVFAPDLMRDNSGNIVVSDNDMYRRRKEILEILQKNAYGFMPSKVPVEGRIISKDPKTCSGNAVLYNTEISCIFNSSVFHFPMSLVVPNGSGRKPLIIVINFRPCLYDMYIPVEEIIDNGFALAQIYYNDITSDDGNFEDRLAAFFPRNNDSAPGKITMWAWGVSRALDYLLTLGWFKEETIGLIGHSRLGKTALWCAANDQRITHVCSNDSGCMGAAYARSLHDGGESTSVIASAFPFWFCPRFSEICRGVNALPFDQHFLLAAIAPRCVLVNSASGDAWADPASEQNSCVGADPAWRAYGVKGYAGQLNTYNENEGNFSGRIGYFKRSGIHFLGRKDWQSFMRFINNHINSNDEIIAEGE